MSHSPSRGFTSVALSAALLFPSGAVAGAKPQYDQYVRIDHHGDGSATLRVFERSRPLLMGLVEVRRENGWHIRLEELPPCEQRADHDFESTYAENPVLHRSLRWSDGRMRWVYIPIVPLSAEEGILNKIVSDYNQSDPPCRYSVIAQPGDYYTVTATSIRQADGTYKPATPLLDTAISIPADVDPLEVIDKALSAATGLNVQVSLNSDVGIVMPKSFSSPSMSGTARDLLQNLFPYGEWEFYCDPHGCIVNLFP